MQVVSSLFFFPLHSILMCEINEASFRFSKAKTKSPLTICGDVSSFCHYEKHAESLKKRTSIAFAEKNKNKNRFSRNGKINLTNGHA